MENAYELIDFKNLRADILYLDLQKQLISSNASLLEHMVLNH